MEMKQNKDASLKSVQEWITKNSTVNLTYSNIELKKNNKQLTWLKIHNGILVREFYEDTGTLKKTNRLLKTYPTRSSAQKP